MANRPIKDARSEISFTSRVSPVGSRNLWVVKGNKCQTMCGRINMDSCKKCEVNGRGGNCTIYLLYLSGSMQVTRKVKCLAALCTQVKSEIVHGRLSQSLQTKAGSRCRFSPPSCPVFFFFLSNSS